LIPTCALFVLLFERLQINLFKVNFAKYLELFFIILIFVGGLLIYHHPNVIYPDSPVLLELAEYKNPNVYASGNWLKENHGKATVIGDQSVYDIYGSYLEFDTALYDYTKMMYLSNQSYYETRFLRWPIWVGSYETSLKSSPLNFVIINKDVFRIDNYMFGSALDEHYFVKFDESNLTDRIYDNGLIIIYENTVKR